MGSLIGASERVVEMDLVEMGGGMEVRRGLESAA